MLSRSFHKYLGLVMLVPLFGWASTGLVFVFKPGYEGAYEMLTLKTYPLQHAFSVQPESDWDEVRIVRSVLGNHLLVKMQGTPLHLNPASLSPAPIPGSAELRLLFEDAIGSNTKRYGTVEQVQGTTARTSTGVSITMDWNSLELEQRGLDRKVIGLLYKLHYLEWTPWPQVNRVLGLVGLLCLVALSVFGLRIYLANRG